MTDEQIILGHTIIQPNYSVKVKQYITKKINNCGFKKMASAGESRSLLRMQERTMLGQKNMSQ